MASRPSSGPSGSPSSSTTAEGGLRIEPERSYRETTRRRWCRVRSPGATAAGWRRHRRAAHTTSGQATARASRADARRSEAWTTRRAPARCSHDRGCRSQSQDGGHRPRPGPARCQASAPPPSHRRTPARTRASSARRCRASPSAGTYPSDGRRPSTRSEGFLSPRWRIDAPPADHRRRGAGPRAARMRGEVQRSPTSSATERG